MFTNTGTFVLLLVWFTCAICSPLVDDHNAVSVGGGGGTTQNVNDEESNNNETVTDFVVSSESALNNAAKNGSEKAKEVEDMDGELQNAKEANDIGQSSSAVTSQSSVKSTAVTVPKENATASTSTKVTDADKRVTLSESSNNLTTESSTIANDYDDIHNGTHDGNGVKNYFLSKMTFLKDDFFLSVMEPIVIGLGCALFILTLVFIVKWTKNSWQRKRMSRPKPKFRGDIRKMKQADRIKLLAQSSDDEF